MIRRRLLHLRFISTHCPQSTNHRHRILQCNKRIRLLGRLGRVKDARQVFDSMLQRDAVSYNSMLTCYTQNSELHEAKSLFDSFQNKNIVTWTILLSGYAKYGLMNKARAVFDSMPERNVISWNALVSGYVQNGDIRLAREVFDKMPERNVSSWNSIITGYCQCGMINEAREVFDRMKERNSVSWLVMVSGYVDIHEYRESWCVFVTMLKSGMMPDQAIFVVGLSAIMGLNDLVLVGSLRAMAIKLGYEEDVVVGTAILNAYTRNGSLDEAYNFFKGMSERNEYTFTCMIAAFAQCNRFDDAIALYESGDFEKSVSVNTTILTAYGKRGRILEAKRIFEEIRDPNTIAWNAMLAEYAENGMLDEAINLFSKMPSRNSASWAAMISGFVQNGKCKEALELFGELHRKGNVPSHSGFTSVLTACAEIGNLEMGKQLHSLTIKIRCQYNSYVGNGLISMYAKCKSIEDFCHAFTTMKVKDVASWNSLVSGLLENHMIDDALTTFKTMPKRDEVSWTAIISGYVQMDQSEKAFSLFHDMLDAGIKPEGSTFISLLSACCGFSATKLGEQVHALIIKLRFDSCLPVCNALITMYFSCGSLDGLCVFEDMPLRDLVSWNAILTGCAKAGLGKETLYIFKQMEAAGVFPDEVSFFGVLSACSNLGLVEIGWEFFNSMSQNYRITPLICHYTCMVDLLGRAGQLSEAEALIMNMPLEPDHVIWEKLLAMCKIHHDCNSKLLEEISDFGSCDI